MGGLPRKPPEHDKLERVETHVPGLDAVINGGLLRGGLYLLAGAPGTGKTVLANHLCFAHVRHGGRALYVTVIAESHARMLTNMSSLAFFDASVLRAGANYMSGYRVIRDQGFEGLVHVLEREIRRLRTSLVILDGMGAVADTAETWPELRAFLNRLRALLELTGCTAVIAMTTVAVSDEPLQTMADGVFQLNYRPLGLRVVREFFVRKFRGSAHLEGAHVFDIDESGVKVYPRVEALLLRHLRIPDKAGERQAFGIPRFDEMLYGGMMGGSTTAVIGAPGSGKTLLGLHLLAEGARRGQRGLYLGLYESPARVIDQAKGIGLPIDRYQREGVIEVQWTQPYELLLDPLMEWLLEHIRTRDIQRFFLDGIDGLVRGAITPERVPSVLTAVMNELRARGVTTLVSVQSEITSPAVAPPPTIMAIAENAVLLRYVELRSQLYRFISIIKVRGSGFDSSIREFSIGDHGIEVASTFDSAEAILSGLGRAVDHRDAGRAPPGPSAEEEP